VFDTCVDVFDTFVLRRYTNKCGVVVAVLVGLTATKILTEKRSEFFREAGSGYNIDAYFVAVNIIATVEHGTQVLLASLFALWLRNTIATWYQYCISFLMLSWLCVSWALFFPLLVPPKNVVLVTGFYMTFFGLLFSGGVPPVKLSDIYASVPLSLFSGLLSPNRYFVEATVVAESRCLPVRSTFSHFATFFTASSHLTMVSWGLRRVPLCFTLSNACRSEGTKWVGYCIVIGGDLYLLSKPHRRSFVLLVGRWFYAIGEISG
jgi:hypothetical protein